MIGLGVILVVLFAGAAFVAGLVLLGGGAAARRSERKGPKAVGTIFVGLGALLLVADIVPVALVAYLFWQPRVPAPLAKLDSVPMLRAIDAGDEAEVARLLAASHPADVLLGPRYGETTPLCRAGQLRNLRVMTLLLASGASVRFADGRGQRPLACAFSHEPAGRDRSVSDAAIAQLLLDHGADPNDLPARVARPLAR